MSMAWSRLSKYSRKRALFKWAVFYSVKYDYLTGIQTYFISGLHLHRLMCLSRNPLCREASAAFAKCPLEARDEAVRTCSDLVNNRQNFRCLARNLRDPMEVRLALIFFFFFFLTTNRFYTERILLSSGRFYREPVLLVLWPLLHRTCPTCPLAAFTSNVAYCPRPHLHRTCPT